MTHLPPQLWLLLAVSSALFGACVGSFLNVCIYRIPLDLSVVRPRSFCMRCKHPIPWWLNIPVLSYFMLGGKCHYCKAPFSFRYCFVEMLTALLFALVALQWPPAGVPSPPFGLVPLADPWLAPVRWLFLSGLVIATFVDFDHFIIPDSVTWGGMAAGLVLSALLPQMHGQSVWYMGLAHSALGLGVGFGVLELVAFLGEKAFRKEAMGFGDVKLLGAVGAFFGWTAALFVLVGASFFGTIVGIALILGRRGKLGTAIPFGPYIALAAATWSFWGPNIVNAYLGLLAK